MVDNVKFLSMRIVSICIPTNNVIVSVSSQSQKQSVVMTFNFYQSDRQKWYLGVAVFCSSLLSYVLISAYYSFTGTWVYFRFLLYCTDVRDSKFSLLNILRKYASMSVLLKCFKIHFVKCFFRNYENS